MLTKKQHELLMLINKRLHEDGVSPSFEEMKEAVGLKSKSGIHRLISALEERGFIRRLPNRARALEVLRMPEDAGDFSQTSVKEFVRTTNAFSKFSANLVANSVELPRYGKIAAGTPIEALCGNDSICVPANMVGNGEHYALTVAGDSMINAGILDGDTVIIRRCNTVENGEIAAVMLIDPDTSDGIATLKRVYKTEDGMMLVAENKAYPPIIVNKETCDGAKILGKAVKCITDVR